MLPSLVEQVTSTLAGPFVTCQGGDVEFELVTDRPVLNLVPTVAARGTVDEEKLRTPQDLADWIVQAGLVDVPPQIDTAGLDRARALREAMFSLVAALIEDRPADRDDRAAVNAAAAVAPPVLRLEDDGLHRAGDLDAVLALVARDCLDLHAGPDRAALRWCDDPTCTRPFVDRSRGQRRRWCGMRGCGDRAKAAAYRQRRRTETP
jgi:predicted RNA-binding Zn ribbon-like protein